jgi:uncharacterized membrane protein
MVEMQISDTVRVEPVPHRIEAIHRDFAIVLLLSLALALLIGLETWLDFLYPLRLILGFEFVLVLPGYCLTVALFPHADDVDSTERLGLSLGLSVAWIPLLALVLDQLPWGISLWSILVGEACMMLVAMAVGVWRRSSLEAGRAYAPEFTWRPYRWWPELAKSEQQTYILTFLALLIAGVSVIWIFAWPSSAEYRTEFYMLGSRGLAEEYPRVAVVGQELGVTLGVTNQERSTHTYRVEIWVEDTWNTNRREQVVTYGPIKLERSTGSESPIAWRMPWSGPDQQVELLLFDGDDTVPYRRLLLFIDVDEP